MSPEDLSLVPKNDFDSEELAVLEEAFNSAWATVGDYAPGSSAGSEEELKTELRRLLFAFASQGVKDPHTLRNLALFNSPLRRVLLEREAKEASRF